MDPENMPCPRCGSTERRDGLEWDFEPDGWCWTDIVCVGCELVMRESMTGDEVWYLTDDLEAERYVVD